MAIALLLIERDDAHRSALCDMLAREHPSWHVAVAGSVAQAQGHLQQGAFDVALVGRQLPDGSAFDLLAALGQIPAVIMVEEGGEWAAARALREGFADYLIQDARLGYLLTVPGQVLSAVDKVRLEQAFQQSAALSEMALEGADLGFWQRNLITAEVRLSQRWLEMLGLDGPQAQNTVDTWQRLVHPDDWALVQDALNDYLAGTQAAYEAEYRMRHRDGHWIWVASRGRVVDWTSTGQARLISGTYMDVTARHRADVALNRQHRLLQALSRAQSAFIAHAEPHAAFEGMMGFVLEITGARAAGLFECVSGTGQAPQWSVQALVGALPQAFPAWMAQVLGPGAAPGRVQQASAETEIGDRRWQVIPVASAGRVVACVGLVFEASVASPDLVELEPLLNTASQLLLAWRARQERRQAQEQLREATEQLAQKTRALEVTLDTISQGIASFDEQGVLRFYNRRFQELLEVPEPVLRPGVTAEELLQFQVARGDLGPGYELLSPEARAGLVAHPHTDGRDLPDQYLRRTVSGRVLEVRSRPQPGGGWVRTFNDVTPYVDTQEALRLSEERWRHLSLLSSDWYWEQDADFRFVRIDGQHDGRSGLMSTQVLGRTRWEIDAPNLTEAQWAEHRRTLQAHEPFQDFEMQRFGAGDGLGRWVSVSGAPLFDAQGQFKGYLGVGRDITERKRNEAIIERLAFYDELTGLPNRRLLLQRLGHALSACGHGERHGALLFLDLDNFKDLNDTLGHDRGDQLLSQVATRLVACVRPDDTVARLGGDEFVVVLDDLGPQPAGAVAASEGVAQKILLALNQPYPIGDSLHHSTPSIGIALFSDAGLTPDELLKRGDLAMYQAKAAGRNTLCFFDPGMQEAVSARSAMESDMRQALQRGEFRLLYQPVVDGRGRILGVEALVRWNHPQRGHISPAEFIPLAEKTGLILPLGRWVLQTACRQLVSWSHNPRMAHLTMAVNVSAREFRDPAFVEAVVAVLEHTGAQPQLLKLELTESLLLNDVEDIIAKMTRLQMRGVGFSLDDFGTGYSSLSYLKRLPLDQLKIDQSFVRDVLTDPNDATIARTIIALAASLGLAVVAEGVETEGQRAFLMRNGCEAFQGYLFSRPIPAVALDTLVLEASDKS